MLWFRGCSVMTLTVLLGACAGPPVGPTTSIEQGDFQLVVDSVVVGTGSAAAISAIVTIHDQRRGIAVLASDCDDGVGSIRVVDEHGLGGLSEVTAFGRGNRPADVLFNTLCAARHGKASAAQGAP